MDNLTEEIRNLCDKPWVLHALFQNKTIWNKIFTSLDTIEDAQMAIDDFSSLEPFNAFTGGYLNVYGLLQAFMVQQDACKNLRVALCKKNVDLKKDFPELFKIREIRNDTVGHPTSRSSDKSFHGISRVTLSKEAFTLRSSFMEPDPSAKFETVIIKDCIENQYQGVKAILSLINEDLRHQVLEHMEKFNGKSLNALFHNNLGYYFQKIGDYKNADSLANFHFETVFSLYLEIKEGIISRHGAIDATDGVPYCIERLDYIFNRLNRDMVITRIADDLELEIFIAALKAEFKNLQSICKEIDEDLENIDA